MNKTKLMILGFAGGVLSASLGIGAGGLLIPALVLFFSQDIRKAIGLSLVTIFSTVAVGSVVHYYIAPDLANPKIALFISAGAVIGAFLGAKALSKVRSIIIIRCFSGLLVLIGFNMLFSLNGFWIDLFSTENHTALILLGVFAGCLSAMFGIGGGMVVVPAANMFFALTMREVIPVSLVVILFSSAAGMIFHIKEGNIDLNAVKCLVPGAVLGAATGAVLSHLMPENMLRICFSVYVFWAAIRMFLIKKQ